MAGLYAPLPTLRRRPRGRPRTARGRCGSLLLHRSGLSPPTPCRSPGALTRVAARTLAPSPICDQLHRRLQPFRHLHDCSGCFRLERSPGGACTHWKAPPCHGARKERSFADRVASGSNRPSRTSVARPRRREFHLQCPLLLGRRARDRHRIRTTARFYRRGGAGGKLSQGAREGRQDQCRRARQRGFPVPSACRGAVCRRSRLARFGLEDGARRSVMTSRRRGRWSRRRRRG